MIFKNYKIGHFQLSLIFSQYWRLWSEVSCLWLCWKVHSHIHMCGVHSARHRHWLCNSLPPYKLHKKNSQKVDHVFDLDLSNTRHPNLATTPSNGYWGHCWIVIHDRRFHTALGRSSLENPTTDQKAASSSFARWWRWAFPLQCWWTWQSPTHHQ